jgi:transcriptional regulator with XRE-family HTH domain
MTDIGFAAKSKRKAKLWSQEHLSEKAGVSIATISKFENGEPIKEKSKEAILLHLGMLNALSNYRKERSIIGYKSLSLEELRTALHLVRDTIRDGDAEEKIEALTWKRLLTEEVKFRMRDLFKEENLN